MDEQVQQIPDAVWTQMLELVRGGGSHKYFLQVGPHDIVELVLESVVSELVLGGRMCQSDIPSDVYLLFPHVKNIPVDAEGFVAMHLHRNGGISFPS